jgi:hypothetical protein
MSPLTLLISSTEGLVWCSAEFFQTRGLDSLLGHNKLVTGPLLSTVFGFHLFYREVLRAFNHLFNRVGVLRVFHQQRGQYALRTTAEV